MEQLRLDHVVGRLADEIVRMGHSGHFDISHEGTTLRNIQHGTLVETNPVIFGVERDKADGFGPGAVLEASDKGRHGIHLPDASGEDRHRREQSHQGPGIAGVGRPQGDQGPYAPVATQSFDVVAPDEAALGMADDADLVQVITLAEPLDLHVYVSRQFLNTAGIECVEDPSEIQAEDTEAVFSQALFENAEDPPRGSKAIEKQNGMVAFFEVREPFDFVALYRKSKIGKGRVQVAACLAINLLEAPQRHLQHYY